MAILGADQVQFAHPGLHARPSAHVPDADSAARPYLGGDHAEHPGFDLDRRWCDFIDP